NRRDFALEPPSSTLLDLLQEAGIETVGVGKIDDLFSGRGLQQKIHTRSNAEGVRETITAAAGLRTGMVMTNLVDFDTLYGHRQDPRGLAEALTEFDAALPRILNVIGDEDVLVLTADHGNDPTDQSTDHSREYVPLLWYTTWGKRNIDLGVRPSFADAGKTVGEYFGLGTPGTLAGNSFLSQVV
ncbi:MAG: phosphopentomutase, partial [Bacteroidota bacterium]